MADIKRLIDKIKKLRNTPGRRFLQGNPTEKDMERFIVGHKEDKLRKKRKKELGL